MDEAARPEPTGRRRRTPAAPRREAPARSSWERARTIAGLPLISYVIAFALALGFYHNSYTTLSKHGMTGDEPSYLLDAFSMARDGDRNLVGQDADTLIGALRHPGLPAHRQPRRSAGDISIHGAGLPVALVPAVWIGDCAGRSDPLGAPRARADRRARRARAVRRHTARRRSCCGSTRRSPGRPGRVRRFSFSLVAYSDQLYPEVPALLCILVAIVAAMRPRPGWPAMVAGSLAAGYLPWLHVRFIPICFALLAALAVRGLGPSSPPGRQARAGPQGRRRGAGRRDPRSRARRDHALPARSSWRAAILPAFASFVDHGRSSSSTGTAAPSGRSRPARARGSAALRTPGTRSSWAASSAPTSAGCHGRRSACSRSRPPAAC